MAIIPTREADDDHHYSRIFPPWPRQTWEQDAGAAYFTAITELVGCMEDKGEKVCEHQPRHSPEIPINAGYTYFGQFLDHELTKDTSNVAEAWNAEPHSIENMRSSRLDLDLLYGSEVGAANDATLFEADGTRLKIGPPVDSTIGTPGPARRSFDIRVENGELKVADERTRDNLILREMTAVFARLHNRAVEQWRGSVDPRQLFAKARLQTMRQFQRIVWEDYLPQVLDWNLYASVFGPGAPRKIEWRRFTVPAEFSAAAMRFGHSMVLDQYFLNAEKDVPLNTVLGQARKKEQLTAEWEIDWGAFYQNASGSTTISARPINTRMVPELHHLDLEALLLYNDGAPFIQRDKAAAPKRAEINLLIVSLMRGAGLRLATGQMVAEGFGFRPLTEELCRDCAGALTPQGEVLRRHNLVSQTPLLFYILKEAEIANGGNKLGPTGSQLIAETVFAALAADQDSYLYHRDPPLWDFGAGDLEPIDSLSDLFSRAPEL